MVAKNQDCDKCGKHTTRSGSIHRLGTGGGGGVYLCRGCWADEMKWRRMRNKKLMGDAKFPIRKWPVK